MENTNDKPAHMYGISRIDDEKQRSHAWRVSLLRHGKRLVKNFPDKKYGGSEAALTKAIRHRDEIIRDYPPISRKQFSNAKRRNNKTGITGVYKYNKSYISRDGTARDNWYWEANWPTAESESACQSFSVKRYGDALARQLAIRTRNEQLNKVRGTFWASKRGDIHDRQIDQAKMIQSDLSHVA